MLLSRGAALALHDGSVHDSEDSKRRCQQHKIDDMLAARAAGAGGARTGGLLRGCTRRLEARSHAPPQASRSLQADAR